MGHGDQTNSMRTSHALLLRLLHDPRFDFARTAVQYVDRGAPGDMSEVEGDRIIRLDTGWMEIVSDAKTKFIPYHRIRCIFYDGAVMWKKSEKKIEN